MPNSNLTDEELVELFNTMEFPYRCHKDELYDRVKAINHVLGKHCYMKQLERASEYYDLSPTERDVE